MYSRYLISLVAFALLAQEKSAPPKKVGLPLKSERKIEFTTDEATWLSLTLTPDGKTIIFELLGDLYSLPIGGGEAKPVTTGMAFDSQPSVSPDGKKIAFISDRDGAENLWICNLDGSDPKQLSKDAQGDFQSPSWTADGDYVLVSRKQANTLHEVWMYNIQGGSGVQVTKSSPKADTPPQQRLRTVGVVASPDGKYFYYARRTGNFTYNTTFPIWQVVRSDRTTGDEDVITSAPGSAFRPVISPDGKKLVFGTRQDTETGLRVRDLETGEEKWLKYGVQRDDQESAATRDVLPGYSFTPDSRDVIVSYGGKIHRVQVSTGEASDIPFTAKVSQELGPELKFASRVEEGPVKARLIHDAERIGGREADRVFVADAFVQDGCGGGREGDAADEFDGAGISTGMVAGRAMDRVCDLGRRGRRSLEDACGRVGRADQVDASAGVLSRSGVVSGFEEDRGAAAGTAGSVDGYQWLCAVGDRDGCGLGPSRRRGCDADRSGAGHGASAFHARCGEDLRLFEPRFAIVPMGWDGPADGDQGGREEPHATADSGIGSSDFARREACAGEIE